MSYAEGEPATVQIPIRPIAVTLLLVSLVACGRHYFGLYRTGISENQQALQELQLGMSAVSVRTIMGDGEVVRYNKLHLVDPWRSEAFSLADGSDVLILFYVTQPPRKYYRPEDDALTPIVLEDDQVVGWGWTYLRQNHDRYRIATPQEQR